MKPKYYHIKGSGEFINKIQRDELGKITGFIQLYRKKYGYNKEYWVKDIWYCLDIKKMATGKRKRYNSFDQILIDIPELILL